MKINSNSKMNHFIKYNFNIVSPFVRSRKNLLAILRSICDFSGISIIWFIKRGGPTEPCCAVSHLASIWLAHTYSSSRDAALRERGRCRDLLAGEPLADGVVNTLKKQYFAGKECKHRRPLKYYDTGWIGGKLLFLSVQ